MLSDNTAMASVLVGLAGSAWGVWAQKGPAWKGAIAFLCALAISIILGQVAAQVSIALSGAALVAAFLVAAGALRLTIAQTVNALFGAVAGQILTTVVIGMLVPN